MLTDIKFDLKGVIINGERLTHINSPESSPTGSEGCIRKVYVGQDYVVKIGSVGEAYLEIDESDRKFFAEVVYVDIMAGWLVQKRINCIPNQPVTLEDWEQLVPIIQKYDISDVVYKNWGRGREPHNWTVDLDGQPIIFDYDFSGCDSYQMETY